MIKFCKSCKTNKTVEEFHVNKRTLDGRTWNCKICSREYTRARHDLKQATDPEYRRKACERVKKWVQDNPEKKRASNSLYEKRHPEKVNLKKLLQYKKNPEKFRNKSRAFYAKYPERFKAVCTNYRIKNRDIMNLKRREKYKKNPNTRRAENFIANQVSLGIRCRASLLKCLMCNAKALHYHHHLGYDKAFFNEVIPICAKCHSGIHCKK